MPDSIAHSNRMLQRSVWQYANGERNFRLQDLKSLSFIQANLSGADLSNSDLSDVNLNWTIVKETNFKGANLQGAKMPDGRMHNNYLGSANYLGV